MAKISKVLLVDDDPTAIYITTSLLKRLEVAEQIVTARNGLEAFDFIRKECLDGQIPNNCPTLILLDIKMPIMNGFEFLEAFQKLDLHPAPQVVMLTSSMHPKEIERAKEFHVTAFLNKPLSRVSLTNLLEQHFGG